MSDLVLNHLINLIGGLVIPSFIFILASWRVARLRNLTADNYQSRVEESVAETIKEQLSSKVINPLFTQNDIMLPPGRRAYEVIDILVPGNDIELLSSIYNSLAQHGVESVYYIQLIERVHFLWGGG